MHRGAVYRRPSRAPESVAEPRGRPPGASASRKGPEPSGGRFVPAKSAPRLRLVGTTRNPVQQGSSAVLTGTCVRP